MVCDDADFIDTYHWFLERSPAPEQAFESTRRIFRGGPITGGAPFTKDGAYLSGFLAVSTFIRAAFVAGRPDAIVLLFAGKLDLYAVPALAELRRQGLCEPARFVPLSNFGRSSAHRSPLATHDVRSVTRWSAR